jgi:Tfp pilus assembly protein PilV
MAKIKLTDKDIRKSVFITKTKGFLMVEVLMAMFIVTAGLMVVLTLLSKTTVNTNQDRDSVIGMLLAQEGAEMVRNIRDNNWASGGDAFTANFPASSSSSCKLAKGADSSLDCTSSNFYLYLKNNFYTLDNSGTSTKFQRKIFVSYDTGSNTSANSATITSMVTWGSFPPINNNPPNVAELSSCSAGNRCVYTQAVLTTWGG